MISPNPIRLTGAFFLTLICSIAFSQKTTFPKPLQWSVKDTIDKYSLAYIESVGIKSYQFNKLISKNFSELIGSENGISVGNFASIDTKDSKVDFNSSIAIGKKTILSLSLKGKSLDGIAPVFSNSSFNSGIEFSTGLNILVNKPYLIFENRSLDKLYSEEQKLIDKYENYLLNAKHHKELEKAKSDSVKLEVKILKKGNSPFQTDSLTLRLLNIKKQIAKLKNVKKEKLLANARQTYRKSQKSLYFGKDSPLQLRGYNMNWISLGVNVKRNSFHQIFTDLRSTSKTSVTLWNLEGKFNMYRYSTIAFDSYYFASGIRIGKSDNFGTLTKKEISITDSLNTNSNILEKYNAYQGDYINNLSTLDIFIDYYLFLLDNQALAFHIYPSYQKKKGTRYTWNGGLGILVPFKKKDDGAIINAELFIEYPDLTGRNEYDDNSDRLSIGLKFSIPFTSNLINYNNYASTSKS